MSIDLVVDQLFPDRAEQTDARSLGLDGSALVDFSRADVHHLFVVIDRHLHDGVALDERRFCQTVQWLSDHCQPAGWIIDDATRQTLTSIYRRMGRQSQYRWVVLRWLAECANHADLAVLTRLLGDDPPRDVDAVAQAILPLFRSDQWDVSAVFPDVLAGLAHPQLAAPVLDLANYLVRCGRVTEHPATDRVAALLFLVGGFVQRLERVAASPVSEVSDRKQVSHQVEESVAILIAACDALGLIGDENAVGKLRAVMALQHRRLRSEAAAALCRLGEPEGIDVLLEMVAEPVVRLRILADADELGIADRIAPQYKTPEAQAEAEVAVTLAQPTYFGLPPHRVEHFYSCRLHWPGFAEKISCHLVRFHYEFGARQYANVALAGPLTQAVRADLNDLSPQDILAFYAGSGAEHDEIHEIEPCDWSDHHRNVAEQLAADMVNQGCRQIGPMLLGQFFDDYVLVARVERDGLPGLATNDLANLEFNPQRAQQSPLGPHDLFRLHIGRQLLDQFNPSAD